MAAEPKQIESSPSCIQMESVDRFSKLPLVEGSYQTGKNIYDKVKDFNSITNWTMSTAENTFYKAVEIGKPYAAPVVQSLETPIKKVDGLLCTGLDFVEANVEGVKLPPGEFLLQIYNSTKDYITSYTSVQKTCELGQSTIQGVKSIVEPAMETAMNTVQCAKSKIEPALESAKQMVEPAVQGAKSMVEPYVQSSLDKANAIKDYGTQKIEEYLHTPEKKEDETVEEKSGEEKKTVGP